MMKRQPLIHFNFVLVQEMFTFRKDDMGTGRRKKRISFKSSIASNIRRMIFS